mmetsp:Transcript_7650/g.10858  ORF Transcript_7650/g.10858 Transcript_7650/m.10858 type:complete len:113 (+) Transcript_7650:2309-2647(+)
MVVNKNTEVSSILFNPSDDRLAKKKILTKGTILKIDSSPFIKSLTTKPGLIKKMVINSYNNYLLLKLINRGYLLAKITSRPGQSGNLRGVILEDKELILTINKNKKLKKLLL